MSKKTVKHEVDLANLPPLSEKQKAELAALAARADGDVVMWTPAICRR